MVGFHGLGIFNNRKAFEIDVEQNWRKTRDLDKLDETQKETTSKAEAQRPGTGERRCSALRGPGGAGVASLPVVVQRKDVFGFPVFFCARSGLRWDAATATGKH